MKQYHIEFTNTVFQIHSKILNKKKTRCSNRAAEWSEIKRQAGLEEEQRESSPVLTKPAEFSEIR
jgi:hypothetical protein